MTTLLSLLVLQATVSLEPSTTTAAEAAPLWKEEWRRVSWPEATAFAGLEAVSLVGPLVVTKPSAPKWRGGILFDDAIQGALVVSNGRGAVSSASDAGLYALQALPLVDAGVTAWWFRGDRDTAIQLALIDLESYAFTDLVVWAMKTTIARERPRDFHLGCFESGVSDPACAKAKSTSFPSNHAATSFTAASLFCTHHSQMALYGGSADAWACAGALAGAAGVAVARVVADNHYATDILAGSAIGIVSGWAIPRLLHFRSFRHAEGAFRPLAVLPLPTTSGMTLSIVGSL